MKCRLSVRRACVAHSHSAPTTGRRTCPIAGLIIHTRLFCVECPHLWYVCAVRRLWRSVSTLRRSRSVEERRVHLNLWAISAYLWVVHIIYDIAALHFGWTRAIPVEHPPHTPETSSSSLYIGYHYSCWYREWVYAFLPFHSINSRTQPLYYKRSMHARTTQARTECKRTRSVFAARSKCEEEFKDAVPRELWNCTWRRSLRMCFHVNLSVLQMVSWPQRHASVLCTVCVSSGSRAL